MRQAKRQHNPGHQVPLNIIRGPVAAPDLAPMAGEQAVFCEPIEVELVEGLPPEALALLAAVPREKSTQGYNNPAAVRQCLADMRALPVGYVSPLLLEQDLEGFDAPDTYSCDLPFLPSPSQHSAPGSPEEGSGSPEEGSGSPSLHSAFRSASWIKLGLHTSSERLGGSSVGCWEEQEQGEASRQIGSHSGHRARRSGKPKGTDEIDELLAVLGKALPAGGQLQKQPLRPQRCGSPAAAAEAEKAPHMPLCGLGLMCRRATAA
jgi:hypothetical protein